MAATGTGTQADPYVVDNWPDFLTVCNLTTSTYIVWADSENKVIDFNTINDRGFTDTITIKGNVDFNSWELRNLNSSARYVLSFYGASNNKPTVQNLKITNARHVPETATGGQAFIYEQYVIFDHISISYEFDYSVGGASYAINATSGTGTYYRLGIYAYGMVLDNSWQFMSTARISRYCRFHCDVQATNCTNLVNGDLIDSVVSGSITIDNDSVSQFLVGGTNSTLNVIRVQSNKTVRYNGKGISLKVDKDYTGDIVRPNISTWDEHVLTVNTAQARTEQAAILAAGFPLHRSID